MFPDDPMCYDCPCAVHHDCDGCPIADDDPVYGYDDTDDDDDFDEDEEEEEDEED